MYEKRDENETLAKPEMDQTKQLVRGINEELNNENKAMLGFMEELYSYEDLARRHKDP